MIRLYKKLVFSFFVSLACYLPTTANAGIIFFSWGGEVIEKIADFPRTDEYKSGDKHVDAGIRYKEITIFFLPVYQYGFKYCGVYEGDDDHFLDLTKDQLFEIANGANIKVPDPVNLGFWKEWGGRVVLFLLLVIYFGFNYLNSKNKNNESTS